MRALVVTVPADEVEVASDVLWQLGVRAIEERSGDDGRDDGRDGDVELWTAVGDEAEAVDRATAALGERWPTRLVDIIDAAADTWREFAGPMWIDDGLVVVPAWQRHVFDDGVTTIEIEPGGAFGLGDHPTTLLSLRAARRHLGTGHRVLDVGCGTGVITVMAAMIGDSSVRAVDVANAAIEATRDNAARNGVADHVDVDTTPVGDLDGSFHLVVANILAPTLVALADDLRRLTASDGRLVISGILADRHDHVLSALAPMIVERTDTLDGWAAVTLRHPPRDPEPQLARARMPIGAIRRNPAAWRSSSDSPPQKPYSWLRRANSTHSTRTEQPAHTSWAAASRRSRACGRSAAVGKKRCVNPLHAP
jgi:ribosomal protein L11 methyltransferase